MKVSSKLEKLTTSIQVLGRDLDELPIYLNHVGVKICEIVLKKLAQNNLFDVLVLGEVKQQVDGFSTTFE